ncbi:hypothetical protein BDZ45DRAFT_748059 [Acephala macrosclerotiorum]|nr:hypothetical protein BDZ45DRAFT_748059 [Acephala macrosclerotiorum]
MSVIVTPDPKKPFRIQDMFQRIYKEQKVDDRYISPYDGRLVELMVQCTDRVYSGPPNSTYKRTFIRNIAPKTLWVANWPMSHLDYGPKDQRNWARFLMIVKWPITCIALYAIIGLPGVASTGGVVNGGCYDPFLYRYWGYCKITRNAVEQSDKISKKNSQATREGLTASEKAKSNRILEPRMLCFLKGEEGGNPFEVSKWRELNPGKHGNKCPDYIFVAPAARAAREAGVEAYWIGSSCMGKGEQLAQDVFRISDVVRGAHSLAIIVGTGSEDPKLSDMTPLQKFGMRLWTLPEVLLSTPHRHIQVLHRGDSVSLKFSKMQLAPLGNLTLSRLELVIIALKSLFARETAKEFLPGDETYALMGLLRRRPMIDDSDSAFQALARLSLANDNDMLLERLMCIMASKSDQEWWSAKDTYHVKLWDIYPTCQIAGVCRDDTVLIDGAFGATIHWVRFQKVASARRAMTWKRLACQLILHGGPYILLAGILLLVASLNAKSLLTDIDTGFSEINEAYTNMDQVYEDMSSDMTNFGTDLSSAISKASGLGDLASDVTSSISTLASKISAGAPAVPSVIVKDEHAVGHMNSWATFGEVVGIFLIMLASFVFLSAPFLTRILYRGKFFGTQCWLFGFEGYLDIETIESQIFGSRMHRLRWSEYGSSLSRYTKNKFDERMGVDPIIDDEVRQKVHDAITNTDPKAMRVFTLVDTNTMTVTLFEALRPPVAVLLCAEEGGMQRAIACSYDWTTGTCYRETVQRMETPVLEKMSRVSRVKVGMKRT